jgi:hypothetical protein
MADFTADRVIQASSDAAWRVLADLSRWPEWTASMASVEVVSGNPPGVGSLVRVAQPKLPPNVWTITEWKPGASFAWEMRSPGVHCVATHELVPHPDGCRLILRLTMGGLLGGIVARLGAGITARYMALEADGLKARAEGAR